ncbi:MAG: hypothetical protein JO267_15990 [Alphaproteobacteria bacterium]|nr:hypothetical protein [Alphaproteobacteria bacterium]MBV9863640.1 hypothetical protein [Alphaproteobacteria bacterium]
MHAALACFRTEPMIRLVPVEDQIRAFLKGETHGEALLHALYDDVLSEPIPERLRTVLKG